MNLEHGHDDDHDHDDRHRCIGVTVKTPAGFASAFATSGNRRAGRLINRAVATTILITMKLIVWRDRYLSK